MQYCTAPSAVLRYCVVTGERVLSTELKASRLSIYLPSHAPAHRSWCPSGCRSQHRWSEIRGRYQRRPSEATPRSPPRLAHTAPPRTQCSFPRFGDRGTGIFARRLGSGVYGLHEDVIIELRLAGDGVDFCVTAASLHLAWLALVSAWFSPPSPYYVLCS